MQCLISIDGPKGAGKTTLWTYLKEHLKDVEFLSLDKEKAMLTKKSGSLSMDFQWALEIVVEKLNNAFKSGKNVILDTGLTKERMEALESIAKSNNVHYLKFALTAPYEVLCARVGQRDRSKGNEFDQERFDQVLAVQQAKSFDDFEFLDSSLLSTEEMADIIIKAVKLDL